MYSYLHHSELNQNKIKKSGIGHQIISEKREENYQIVNDDVCLSFLWLFTCSTIPTTHLPFPFRLKFWQDWKRSGVYCNKSRDWLLTAGGRGSVGQPSTPSPSPSSKKQQSLSGINFFHRAIEKWDTEQEMLQQCFFTSNTCTFSATCMMVPVTA